MTDTEALLAQRGSIYGDPVPQYGRIAQVWSGILGHEVSAHQAAVCMAALKLVRAVDAPDHLDSLDDAHGYVTIAQRIQAAWTEPVPYQVVDDYQCQQLGDHEVATRHTYAECPVVQP